MKSLPSKDSIYQNGHIPSDASHQKENTTHVFDVKEHELYLLRSKLEKAESALKEYTYIDECSNLLIEAMLWDPGTSLEKWGEDFLMSLCKELSCAKAVFFAEFSQDFFKRIASLGLSENELSFISFKSGEGIFGNVAKTKQSHCFENPQKEENATIDIPISELHIFPLENNRHVSGVLGIYFICKPPKTHLRVIEKILPALSSKVHSLAYLHEASLNFEESQKQLEETVRIVELLKEVEIKNGQLVSAMNYAYTIQKAVLPKEDQLRRILPDYFLIYKPKDIVSGDYYWYAQYQNIIMIAVVDCTGHGVPGAFVSLIGQLILSHLVNKYHITSPAELLENLDERIIEMLNQEEGHNSDGMEACICAFEKLEDNTYHLRYSGARRPMYYFNSEDNILDCISGVRRGIGKSYRDTTPDIWFEDNIFMLNQGDTIYLTTDGYVDQVNDDRKRFGKKRFEQILRVHGSSPLTNQKEQLIYAMDRHKGNQEQRDDITLMGIRF